MPAAARSQPIPIGTPVLSGLAVALAIVGGALVAAGSAGPVRAGTSHLVEIEGFAFGPSALVIQVGDTVTWTNLDDVDHTATSTAGAFDSGLLGQGESYSLTFTEPGTYDYLCTPHPTMTGQVVVQAVPAAPAPSQDSGGGGEPLPDVAMEPRQEDPRVPLGIGLIVLAGATAAAVVWRGRRAS